MAAKSWFGTNTVLSSLSQEMSETSPGVTATSSPQMGWVVGTGSTNAADMDAGTNVASSAFTGTGPPDGSLVTGSGSNGDHFRSTNRYTGSFAAGNWTWQGSVIGVTQAGAQDGRMDIRLFRGPNSDGTGATEITSGKQTGSTITNLSTTQQNSSVTFNPGAFSLNNEYLFVQVAWVRTGAGGMSTTDVAFRYGDGGTQLTSTDFTVTVVGTLSATQGANTATTDADVAVVGSATPTQGADTATTDVDVAIAASSSPTQGANTLTGEATSASAGSNATLTATQGGDTVTTAVDVPIGATATVAQGAQTAATDVDVPIAASSGLTQGAQTATTDVDIAITASSSSSQGANTVSTDVDVPVIAAAAASQGAQVLTGSAIIGSFVGADLTASQAGDTMTAQSAIAVSTGATMAQGADTMTATATAPQVEGPVIIVAPVGSHESATSLNVAAAGVSVLTVQSADTPEVTVLTVGSSVEVL